MPDARTDLDVSRDGDWPAQAADTVVRVVDSVRGKTTGPAITVARAIVYGLLAAILGTAALVLLVIGAVRAIDSYVPGEVWAAHLIVGAVFTLAGLFLWTKRQPTPPRA
jgi:hypothetical protein